MGEVEFRREGNKIMFKRNGLEAWQNLQDTFFYHLFSFEHILSSSFCWLPKSSYAAQLLGPQEREPTGALKRWGLLLPLRPYKLFSSGKELTAIGEGQTGTKTLSTLSSFGLVAGALVFPPLSVRNKNKEVRPSW